MSPVAKTLSVPQVLQILESGRMDEFIGTVENQHIEFKGTPYQLSADVGKNELAKDVSALANASGGIILIGFRTEKELTMAEELVESYRPFEQRLFDTDQYRKILQDWICPSIPQLEIRSIDVGGKFLGAIVVPQEAAANRPYIVTRNVDSNGRVRGTLIGFYERVHADIPFSSPERIRDYIKDGLRFAEISRRLDTIEAFLGSSPLPTFETGPADESVTERVNEATKAVDRIPEPNMVVTVKPSNRITFPELFRSRDNSRIVQLLEDPPILRHSGFLITTKDTFISSEIIRGACRRVLAKKSRLFELWADGVTIAIGPADANLLGWATRGWEEDPAKRKPGLTVRNFVLAEVLLNFSNLIAETYKEASPAPEVLQICLKLENMTEIGEPCRLASWPDKGPPWTWRGFKSAPADKISTSCVARFADFDPGVVAYQLFAGVYIGFGFDTDSVPYVQKDQNGVRITRASLIGD